MHALSDIIFKSLWDAGINLDKRKAVKQHLESMESWDRVADPHAQIAMAAMNQSLPMRLNPVPLTKHPSRILQVATMRF